MESWWFGHTTVSTDPGRSYEDVTIQTPLRILKGSKVYYDHGGPVTGMTLGDRSYHRFRSERDRHKVWRGLGKFFFFSYDDELKVRVSKTKVTESTPDL